MMHRWLDEAGIVDAQGAGRGRYCCTADLWLGVKSALCSTLKNPATICDRFASIRLEESSINLIQYLSQPRLIVMYFRLNTLCSHSFLQKPRSANTTEAYCSCTLVIITFASVLYWLVPRLAIICAFNYLIHQIMTNLISGDYVKPPILDSRENPK